MKNNITSQEIWDGVDSKTAIVIFEDLSNSHWAEKDKAEKDRLKSLFEFGLLNRDRFPTINGIENVLHPSKESQLSLYIKKWGDKYFDCQIPSKREGKKSKSPYDELVYLIISYSKYANIDDAEAIRKSHEGAMQSENIIGSLLEEYISSKIEKYGWIWCKGQTIVATDFLFPGNKPVCLQIKNKFNTENSSSDKVRNGTDIKKWFRLTSKRIPDTDESLSDWEELRKIIFGETGIAYDKECDLTEDGFRKFIQKVCKENPDIIVF